MSVGHELARLATLAGRCRSAPRRHDDDRWRVQRCCAIQRQTFDYHAVTCPRQAKCSYGGSRPSPTSSALPAS